MVIGNKVDASSVVSRVRDRQTRRHCRGTSRPNRPDQGRRVLSCRARAGPSAAKALRGGVTFDPAIIPLPRRIIRPPCRRPGPAARRSSRSLIRSGYRIGSALPSPRYRGAAIVWAFHSTYHRPDPAVR